MDTEVAVDQSGTVGVEHQLATKLQAGVDAIPLVREVTLDDGDKFIVGRHDMMRQGRRSIGRPFVGSQVAVSF